VLYVIKRRGTVHRVSWKQRKNRRIYYPGMGKNKIKEIKVE
jgi:hypothetical protein